MEGRDRPAAVELNDDPQPPPPPQTLSYDTKETYIVQIPRDQIYRIPPPANARIVEKYRCPNTKRQGCEGKICIWILLTIAAIAGIGLLVIQLFFRPKTPEFSVTELVVKTSHNNYTHPSYEISLKVNNPNERMGVSYEDGGEILLSFDQKNIGGGKYPSLSQAAKDSSTVHIPMAGSNGTLPSKVEKSMKDTKSKTPVSLSLTIDIPLKMKGFIQRRKKLTVSCDFGVSTLGLGTKILSEKCDSKF